MGRHNILKAHEMNLDHGITCSDFFDGPECIYGITKFSHMYADEFKMKMLGYHRSNVSFSAPVLNLEDLMVSSESADVVDWRKKGAVTKVKDQGNCGSCWAYSATSEIESANFMATGHLPVLSPQQIISCDKNDGGCHGGRTESAFEYVQQAGGIDTLSDYPDNSHISGENGKCQRHRDVVKISGFQYAIRQCEEGACAHQDEDRLAKVLAAKGPISICVNAEPWQHYRGGIVSSKCSGTADSLDHCVQLVGYNKAGPTPYWIVRNSWTTDWGVNGYIHLKMGHNICGVANDATIVEIEKDLLVV